MKHSGRKSADEALALAIASGLTIDAAAKTAKVSRTTAHRRIKAAPFQKLVAEFRARMVTETVGILAKTGSQAAAMLSVLAVHAKTESVKLSACRTSLEYMFRATELADVLDRLAAVELQLKKLERKPGVIRNRQATEQGRGSAEPANGIHVSGDRLPGA